MVRILGRIQSCYISSPVGTDLSYLRHALIERGIQIAMPNDLFPGDNWSEWISRKIADTDLVIGVLTSSRQSQWVLFELGQAVALGRRVVLIAPPKLAAVPFHLERFLVIRASPKNRDAIDFALDQILASPERQTKSATPPSSPRPALGFDADAIEATLRIAMDEQDSRGIELAIIQALRGSGVDILSEVSDPKFGADLAVWSDELQLLICTEI